MLHASIGSERTPLNPEPKTVRHRGPMHLESAVTQAKMSAPVYRGRSLLMGSGKFLRNNSDPLRASLKGCVARATDTDGFESRRDATASGAVNFALLSREVLARAPTNYGARNLFRFNLCWSAVPN